MRRAVSSPPRGPSNFSRSPVRSARIAGWVVAAAALLAVFAAYLQPAMALQLAQQLWSCF